MIPFRKMKVRQETLDVLLLSILAISLFSLFSFYSISYNYEYVNVTTKANITNAIPEILSVVVNNGTNIVLNAGTTKTVECLVQVRDYNGYTDITSVNATFYYYLNQSTDPDDNNVHYTNGSCSLVSGSGYYANYSCQFDVWYYAYNGTWYCNVTVQDSFSYNATAWNTSTILPLAALNVTSPIDYGNLAVLDTSPPVQANITNFGNIPINVTVYGYGAVEGDNLALVCQVGNITVDNERFSLNSADPWSAMTPLTGNPASPIMINGLTIPVRTNDLVNDIVNSTYWRLYVPPNPFGNCTGVIVFSATQA